MRLGWDGLGVWLSLAQRWHTLMAVGHAGGQALEADSRQLGGCDLACRPGHVSATRC